METVQLSLPQREDGACLSHRKVWDKQETKDQQRILSDGDELQWLQAPRPGSVPGWPRDNHVPESPQARAVDTQPGLLSRSYHVPTGLHLTFT